MQFTIISILGLAALSFAADSHLTTWSETGCDKGDVLKWTVPRSPNKNTCQEMGNVKSLRVDDLLSGCTATIYTDAHCTDDKKPARKGDCVGYGGKKIRSFSVDCSN